MSSDRGRDDWLRERVRTGPLLLDAAMGTRLIARGCDLAIEDTSLWTLRRPHEVFAIHLGDVQAGAHALLTNTFGANRVWLGRYGCADEVTRVNCEGVSLAREAAGSGRFVVGCVGPSAAANPECVVEQVEVLLDAGVDGLVLETHAWHEALSSLERIRGLTQRSIWISGFTNLISQHDVIKKLIDAGADAVGFNCVGLGVIEDGVPLLMRSSSIPVLLKPGVLRKNEAGSSPEEFAARLCELAEQGVRILGGCCGTDEIHIEKLHTAMVAAGLLK